LAVLFASIAIVMPAQATLIGPDTAICSSGGKPAAIVHVSGFKTRSGTLRVRAFPTSTPYLFDKRGMIERIEERVPSSGPVDVCVPLPAAGSYAFDVRHDANSDGGTGMSDGGGLSGNPRYTFSQVVSKYKPPVSKVAVSIGNGPVIVPVVLNYFQGLFSFGPLPKAETR